MISISGCQLGTAPSRCTSSSLFPVIPTREVNSLVPAASSVCCSWVEGAKIGSSLWPRNESIKMVTWWIRNSCNVPNMPVGHFDASPQPRLSPLRFCPAGSSREVWVKVQPSRQCAPPPAFLVALYSTCFSQRLHQQGRDDNCINLVKGVIKSHSWAGSQLEGEKVEYKTAGGSRNSTQWTR